MCRQREVFFEDGICFPSTFNIIYMPRIFIISLLQDTGKREWFKRLRQRKKKILESPEKNGFEKRARFSLHFTREKDTGAKVQQQPLFSSSSSQGKETREGNEMKAMFADLVYMQPFAQMGRETKRPLFERRGLKEALQGKKQIDSSAKESKTEP